MIALFAYKILDNFWKPKDEYFWDLAKIAVKAASKFYPTVLYSDARTKGIFDKAGIEFDSYQEASKSFDIVTEHTYGLAKVCAILDQTSPYIALDLDTVLLSKPQSSAHILYGHKEIDMLVNKPISDMQLDLDYLKQYYEIPFDKFKANHSLDIKSYDWRTYPSNSLMLVNSPELIKSAYTQILQMIKGEIKTVPPIYTVQFYEQFLLYNLLKHRNADIEFIYKDPPGVKDYLTWKYLHLDKYDRDNDIKKVIDSLKKLLK
jgi:hypothetical protein